ncbi:MAG TPA: hypothetical protein V6D13_12605 [Halomicronema sp.]
MAKSGQGKKNSSKTQPPTPQPKLIEIDETICYRPSQTPRHQLNRFLSKDLENMAGFFQLPSPDNFPFQDIIKLLQENVELEPEINIKEVEARVKKILGSKNLKVTKQKLENYLKYLDSNLEKPFHLTSREEFLWEEEYLYGGSSKKEYEKLKKTLPCYTDTFKFLAFEKTDEDGGILVNVQRVTDKKVFTMPLCDLQTTLDTSPNHQLIEDYSVWFINYQ